MMTLPPLGKKIDEMKKQLRSAATFQFAIAKNLKGLCHGSTVHFVQFCQLLPLNRYGT